MYQPIAEMSFILIVGSLLLILAAMNAISTFHSKKRAKAAAIKNASYTRPQAKIIALPVDKPASRKSAAVSIEVEEEVV